MTADATTLLDWTAARIADERYWCRGAAARNAAGDSADPRSEEAVRFCIFGGLSWAVGVLGSEPPAEAEAARCIGIAALSAAADAGLPVLASASDINDELGHAAVCDLLDEAREVAQRRRAQAAPGVPRTGV